MFAKLYNTVHQTVFRFVMYFIERELVPDFVIRFGIRRLLAKRLLDTLVPTDVSQKNKQGFVDELKTMPIALHTDKANEQHYELPTEYFTRVLGKRRKYSSCLYRSPSDSLNEAEDNMLDLYCERLQLTDGLEVLELGCGWGSFCLYAAEKHPGCKFTAVSNSRTQKAYIDGQAAQKGLSNLTVITCDMNDFQAPQQFDRVVSVEMFEHMKNYQAGRFVQELLRRVSTWMKPGGRFFCHVFCHKTMPYHFLDEGEDDWMTRYFFTGGTMPSLDLFLHFQDDLRVRQVWYINGRHYSKTLEAWLQLQDRQRRELWPVFKDTYGSEVKKWWVYWRLFYLACSELFNYNQGNEWGVGHYIFEKP